MSRTDAVVEELKRFFESGEVEVGDKLPTEAELCGRYGVGRSTVREAVRTLQVMGYVEIRPGRGAFLAAKKVSGLDTALSAWVAEQKPDVEETLRIRKALGVLAVRFAIERGTGEDLDRIDKARLALEDAVRRRALDEAPPLDEAFHRAIVLAGHSELLAVLDTAVAAAFREWRVQMFSSVDYIARVIVPHQRITLAIFARDPELAEIQMRRYLELLAEEMSD